MVLNSRWVRGGGPPGSAVAGMNADEACGHTVRASCAVRWVVLRSNRMKTIDSIILFQRVDRTTNQFVAHRRRRGLNRARLVRRSSKSENL
jgi:hypothetical protein